MCNSCLDITIAIYGQSLVATSNIVRHIDVNIHAIQNSFDALFTIGHTQNFTITNIIPPLGCALQEASKRLDVSCGLVCSITPVGRYLEVEPSIIWLTPTDDITHVTVYSNVDWIIE